MGVHQQDGNLDRPGQEQHRNKDQQLKGELFSSRQESQMANIEAIMDIIRREAVIDHSRSGGPGGQSVNKTNSQAILKWNYMASEAVTSDQKELILQAIPNRINKEGEVFIHAQAYKSWNRNREEAFERLGNILEHCFTPEKERKKTRPSRSSQRRRLDEKTKQGKKKRDRSKSRKIDSSDW